MDLFSHRCNTEKIALGIVAEPNRYMVKQNKKWIVDNLLNAAIYVSNKQTKIYNTGKGDGYVWAQTDNLTIYSCYITPAAREDEFQDFLLRLKTSIRQHKTEILVGGDFNAKAFSWGSPVEDKKGSMLAEWASEADYTILNDGKTPTFERNGGGSYIDVTMCTPRAAAKVNKWEVSKEENMSYHNNINIEIRQTRKYTANQGNKPQKGWIYKPDKERQLLESIEQQICGQNCTLTAKKLEKIMENACNAILRKKGGRNQHRSTYWWNHNIADLRNECTRARREATRHNRNQQINGNRNNDIQNRYRECRTNLKKAIERAKKEAWENICKEVDIDLWGIGYKIVTGKLGLRSPIQLTDEEQVRVAKELFPEQQVKIWPRADAITEDIPECSVNEVREAGQRIKPKKAAGPDGIPTEVVKLIAMQKPETVHTMLTELIRKGIFPKEWKTGKLVLIEKPGKTQEKKYRPLCLLNVAAKLFEQIINRRLIDEIDAKGGFAKTQFGFRKGSSTMDAVQMVQRIVEDTRDNTNAFLIIVTLDVQNAFNSAPWSGIIKELRKRKISRYLQNLICSYLENRTILVGENSTMTMTCGVPQGSVLGPTLWNIYYDGVLRLKMPEGITTIGYADDLAVVIRGENADEIERNATWAIRRIENWMAEKRLKLAEHKTEMVILWGRRTIKTLTIEMDNQQIKSQRSLKYLGIRLGHNMNMVDHVKAAAEKAEKMVAALGRLMPNTSGPKAGRRKLLSNVVNSIILYGAPVWKEALEQKQLKNILEKVQRKVAIRIVSAYRTVSTKAVQVIAGTVPLHLLAHERTYEEGANRRTQRVAAREVTVRKWQEEWEAERTTAQWTKRLIPQIEPWLTRRHGEVSYYLTQFLSGHGRFRTYQARFKLAPDEECRYCRMMDTPEHTIIQCARWREIRRRTENEIGDTITVESIVTHMLDTEYKWNGITQMIKEILKKKEEEERQST